jgi:hypothetical protein
LRCGRPALGHHAQLHHGRGDQRGHAAACHLHRLAECPELGAELVPAAVQRGAVRQGPYELAAQLHRNVSSVGQALTRSPWGTLDQGGNVVEITDTIAPPPAAGNSKIVWRR